jgi:hypothetical protein
MKVTPESLIIGFPIIKHLNLKIGMNHMEVEHNNRLSTKKRT